MRKVITDYLYIRKVSATPNLPFMANIPEERLQNNYKPFTNTGTDYFGPFYIKLSKATRSNAAQGNRYLIIFTRAVNLEMSNDFQPTLLYITKRIYSMTKTIKRLMSNNGTNFIGAERELKETL